MLDHLMRSGELVAAVLVGVVVTAACGSPPGQSSRPTATASRIPSSSQSASPASSERLSSPSPQACPYANTRALGGPVAAYFWSGTNGCITVTLIDSVGDVSTVTTTSIQQYGGQFTCQDGNQSRPTPDSGLTPGPAYSVSRDRIYWWDGHVVHWLDRSGAQGTETLEAGDGVGLEFAVSPDDARMVITTINFAKWPLHRTTWIEDVGTRANGSVIFDANLSVEPNTLALGTFAGWPWGWEGGRPVLYDFPLCVIVAGDAFIGLSYPSVVDPSTGARLVNFPKCYGGAITSGGVLCTASFTARALDWYDWTGKQIKSWALAADTIACDGDPSPSGGRVLAFCAYNTYTRTSPGPVSQQLLFGPGPSLPQGIAQPEYLRWLDDDLVLESRTLTDPVEFRSAVYIWSLSRQAVIAGPITIPGWYNRPRKWFNPTPPPTRLVT